MSWTQVYDPFGIWWLSTLVAALPIIVLFTLLAGFQIKPHLCAITAAVTAVLVATFVFKMPPVLAASSFAYGVAYGILKIAWIVLAAVYLYDISVEAGQFEIMKESIAGITPDRRLQVLLVAFCFGAFIEGAAGFGAPVAIAGAFMIGLGFRPVSCGGFEFDREYGASGVGSYWDSCTCARGSFKFAGIGFERDDRADSAFYGDDRAVLAGADDGELVGNF